MVEKVWRHPRDDGARLAFGRLTAKMLTPYRGPTDSELENAGVHAVFLGYYLPWDPETSLQVARAHGFQASTEDQRRAITTTRISTTISSPFITI